MRRRTKMNITQIIKEYITYTKPVRFLVFKREKPLIIIHPSGEEVKSNYILYFKVTAAHYRVIFLDNLLNESFVKSFVFDNTEERAEYYFTHAIVDNYFDVKKHEFYE